MLAEQEQRAAQMLPPTMSLPGVDDADERPGPVRGRRCDPASGASDVKFLLYCVLTPDGENQSPSDRRCRR